MISLEQAGRNLGAVVVYEPRPGVNEYGRISSVNDRYVFVEYEGGQTKATSPADLRWSSLQQKPLEP